MSFAGRGETGALRTCSAWGSSRARARSDGSAEVWQQFSPDGGARWSQAAPVRGLAVPFACGLGWGLAAVAYAQGVTRIGLSLAAAALHQELSGRAARAEGLRRARARGIFDRFFGC